MKYVSCLLFVTLVFAACQKASNETTAAGTNTAISQPMEKSSDNPAANVTPAPAMQEVHLIEYSIHMPSALPAGHTTLNIENGGKEDHGLVIEGNGVKKESTTLKRGDTTSLDVDLQPGTYTIYCPVDGHKGKGMTMTVTVK